MAAERIIALGLALPCPMMSGAMPWQGWTPHWALFAPFSVYFYFAGAAKRNVATEK